MPEEIKTTRIESPDSGFFKMANAFCVAAASDGFFQENEKPSTVLLTLIVSRADQLSLKLSSRDHCDAVIAAIAEIRDDVFPEGGDAA